MSDVVNKPVTATWRDLYLALLPFHQGERSWVYGLHDIWRKGAPTPDSIIRTPAHYDERDVQPGNYVARIVPYLWIAAWLQDVAAARGMPISARQAVNITQGELDLGGQKPLIFTDMRGTS